MKYQLAKTISDIVERCEINDVTISNYTMELNFRQQPNQLDDFLALNESELPIENEICIMFNNTLFSPADMLNIKRGKLDVEYELSMVFNNETWSSPLALKFFVDLFISECLLQKLNVILEGSDSLGFYLKLDHKSDGIGMIKQTLEPLYQKLNQIQSQILENNNVVK